MLIISASLEMASKSCENASIHDIGVGRGFCVRFSPVCAVACGESHLVHKLSVAASAEVVVEVATTLVGNLNGGFEAEVILAA